MFRETQTSSRGKIIPLALGVALVLIFVRVFLFPGIQQHLIERVLPDRLANFVSQRQNRGAAEITPSIDTQGWKTYRNEKYGFEFKYPTKYFLHSDNASIDFNVGQPSLALERYLQARREGGEFVILKIFPNPGRLNLLDWLEAEGRGKTSFFSITTNGKFGYENYRFTRVGGMDGISFSPVSGGIYEGAKTNETVFGKETFIFDFWAGRFFSKDEELEQDANAVLSTFKFIDK